MARYAARAPPTHDRFRRVASYAGPSDQKETKAIAEVVAHDAFNERFTIYLNDKGKPVQRTVREMTAGEVMPAIAWHEKKLIGFISRRPC